VQRGHLRRHEASLHERWLSVDNHATLRIIPEEAGRSLLNTDHTDPDQLSGDEFDRLAEHRDDLTGPWLARGRIRWPTPYLYGGD